MSHDILLDLVIDDDGIAFESDWSPRLDRVQLELVADRGLIDIDKADKSDWRLSITADGRLAATAGLQVRVSDAA